MSNQSWWSQLSDGVQIAIVLGASLVACVLIVTCAWYWDRERRYRHDRKKGTP